MRASLDSSAASQTMFYSTLGARFDHAFQPSDNLAFNQKLLLGWRHAYQAITPQQSTMAFSSGSLAFLISGTPVAKDALLLNGSLEVTQLARHLQLSLAYVGEFAPDVNDNGFMAKLAWQFH
ncbi:autotransporter domain-containing protein [Legionella dresdenensis]|uniref:Autotransporter domain-containing protein n=1 Tax=Legionella dresdenensis TaxID=450200 RepID=A0ABV8CCB6_9GAMM